MRARRLNWRRRKMFPPISHTARARSHGRSYAYEARTSARALARAPSERARQIQLYTRARRPAGRHESRRVVRAYECARWPRTTASAALQRRRRRPPRRRTRRGRKSPSTHTKSASILARCLLSGCERYLLFVDVIVGGGGAAAAAAAPYTCIQPARLMSSALTCRRGRLLPLPLNLPIGRHAIGRRQKPAARPIF